MPLQPRQTVHKTGAAAGLHSPPCYSPSFGIDPSGYCKSALPAGADPLDIKLDAGFAAFSGRAGRKFFGARIPSSNAICLELPSAVACHG